MEIDNLASQNFDVSDNLKKVRERIARAAMDAGRDPASVNLICVSKTVESIRIAAALSGGEALFGENRVQEAMSKWPDLRTAYPKLELHLIGPLQSNKVREAVRTFDSIQTVDRPKIAEALAREFERVGHSKSLFVEINTGREPQKAGVLPEEADPFLDMCRKTFNLEIKGLMCIPPQNEQKAPHFALLSQIAKRNGINHLSMGMSDDFEAAIALGATYVRVGTAIFGHRS